MRRPATLGKMLLFGLLALAMLPAQGRTLRAQVESVRTGVGSLQGVEMVLACATVLINLIADIVTVAADPRVKL